MSNSKYDPSDSNYAVDYTASHSKTDETLATALPEPQN